MNTYRIYVLNPEERVAEVIEDAFATDLEALKTAEDLSIGQYAAEVWDGERLVARLGSEFSLS
jgi:hypothetical protein